MQQRYTIYEVPDDWQHELILPKRTVRSSNPRANGPAVQLTVISSPQSAEQQTVTKEFI